MNLFTSKNPSYEHLRKKWTARHRQISESLFDKHLRQIAIGSLGGLMLLPTSGVGLNKNHLTLDYTSSVTASKDNNAVLAAELKDKVPTEMRNLTLGEEKKITDLLSQRTNLKVTGELQGIRLNRTYGLIGGEQHLYRYPGDTVFAHSKDVREWAMFGGAGIAPNLGAWGYFAPSKEQFTKKDDDREKYYIAVQTFLAPGFAERTAKYRDFFKYRKMLLVNPQTGQTVVTDIADAGPSEWTGKHLGGSPEVMEALGLAGGPRQGPVLYFFIDDPQDSVPFGPLKIPDEKGVVRT